MCLDPSDDDTCAFGVRVRPDVLKWRREDTQWHGRWYAPVALVCVGDNWVVTTSRQQVVVAWPRDGGPSRVLPHVGLGFAMHGDILVGGRMRGIVCTDLATGTHTTDCFTRGIIMVATVSRRGQLVYVARVNSVYRLVWRALAGLTLCAPTATLEFQHPAGVRPLLTATAAVTAVTARNGILVVRGGTVAHTIGYTEQPSQLCITPCGTVLAIVSARDVHMRLCATGDIVWSFTIHGHLHVMTAVLAPGGQRLWAAADSGRLLSVPTGTRWSLMVAILVSRSAGRRLWLPRELWDMLFGQFFTP
jgi:hypothetical protein